MFKYLNAYTFVVCRIQYKNEYLNIYILKYLNI